MFFKNKKGLIALDIDGTITLEPQPMAQEVVRYFHQLYQEQWEFIFITGRPFQWGFRTLQVLDFPYLLAVQNGAILLEMPSQKVSVRHYLNQKILPPVEKVCQQWKTDCVIYGGFDVGDQCYYCPRRFSPSLLAYLIERSTTLGEKWHPLDSFHELPIHQFSSLKCFMQEKEAQPFSQQMEEELHLHAPPIRDPFNRDYFVIQLTHPQASKGGVIRELRQKLAPNQPILAAGDDYNDLTMLQAADIRIVMADAPLSLQALADVKAPSVKVNGIIEGLAQAQDLYQRGIR